MLQEASNTPAAAAATQAATPAPMDQIIGGVVADTNAAALKEMGISSLLNNMVAHPGEFAVTWVVVVTLVLMSIACWYYTVVKTIQNQVIKARANHVIRTFWETSNAQEAIRFMEEQPANEPFSKIALDCAIAAAHHQKNEGSRLAETLSRSEFIDRALRQAVTRESSRLENGMTILATTGSAAPFIGLLGTTWGIYKALIKIGASGSASLDAVAGPVGEALLKTALGLVVAIPAVMAYNFFNRANRTTNAAFDAFAHDLHDFFATGSRVGEGSSKR